ncbi:hypothetical protein AAG747_27860 [Rapidithrix thailandica]|uniref:DUF4178 domain-containing protein n=1 Tax=Rapidithrix thailandica TaxID=413964 RepID=A0AAW9SKW6_9BACT
MIKIMAYILGGVLVFVFLYQNEFIRNRVAKLLLPAAYKEYRYLSSNTVASENYEIKKLISGNASQYFFDKELKNFIIRIRDNKLWKINEQGDVEDSLSTSAHLTTSGLIFEEDYFIDWVVSGNKSPQPYREILDADSLSSADVEAYFNNAAVIDFGMDYPQRKGKCYLKIEGHWIVLEFTKRFEEFKQDFEKGYYTVEFKGQAPKNNERIEVLKINAVFPFYHWEDPENPLHIQYFIEETSQSKSFYDINNTSRSGWNGTGYFRLNYHSETLYFKAYTFKRGIFEYAPYSPDISIYQLNSGYGVDLTLIELYKRGNTKRDYSEVGVYVLRKKNKE